MNFPGDFVIKEITHVTIANYKKYEKSTMHIRPWFGIAFSLGGELTYHHNNMHIQLSEHNVALLPQNSSYEVCCTKPGAFAVINFLTADSPCINEFVLLPTKRIDIFKNEFFNMHKFFITDSPQKTYFNLSSLYKMFYILTNDSFQKSLPVSLNNALDYIDKNINVITLSNTQIAEHLHISEVYLRKLFSANLNLSVNKYIQKKRIDKAMTLLLETSFSITEISEMCGFSCIYYFSNSFKRQTGYTPTQYRYNNSFNLF